MTPEKSKPIEQPLPHETAPTTFDDRAVWSVPTLQILDMDQVAGGVEPGAESEDGLLS